MTQKRYIVLQTKSARSAALNYFSFSIKSVGGVIDSSCQRIEAIGIQEHCQVVDSAPRWQNRFDSLTGAVDNPSNAFG